MKQILLIEDDIDYAEIVSRILRDEGFAVDVEHTSVNGVKAVQDKKYDLVIADLDLDSFNGLQVAEIIRRDIPKMPVMILTGSVSEEDELRALDTTLNDYVKKSVSFNILIGRINHIFEMRNQPKSFETIIKSPAESLEVNLDTKIVKKKETEVFLTVLEYELLLCFLQNKEKILTREEILREVWKVEEEDGLNDPRVVDTFVKNIRAKLQVRSIYSIRGVGYRWHE